jgi:hypothetical protein
VKNKIFRLLVFSKATEESCVKNSGEYQGEPFGFINFLWSFKRIPVSGVSPWCGTIGCPLQQLLSLDIQRELCGVIVVRSDMG